MMSTQVELTAKLQQVQAELKAPKEKDNDFGKYKYRSCEDILESVKPILGKHGLALLISDELQQFGNRFYVKASVTLTDGENSYTVSAYAREAESKKGMDESQITGTASSYARKYALNGLFCIDDTKDADTNEYTERQQNKGKSKGSNALGLSDADYKKLKDLQNEVIDFVKEKGIDFKVVSAEITKRFKKKTSYELTYDQLKELFDWIKTL